VRPEPDHPHGGDREQAEHARDRNVAALAPGALAEHQERQHEAGRELHPDAGGERHRRRSRAARGTRAQQQRERQREQQHRVVVRAADREHEQHRVQAHEREREAARVPEASRRAGGQPDRGEAAQHRHRLQCPQPARQAERCHGVGREREQRAVWRVLERPADEREDRVGRSFRGEVRVGVEPVQRAHAREREVAEDVLRDQRRAEKQDHVRRDHDAREHGQRHGAGCREGDEVARADDQHQRLEAPLAEFRAEAAERARQPPRPAAAVARHVARGRRGGVDAQHRQRRQKHDQRGHARHPKRRRRHAPGRSAAPCPTGPRPGGRALHSRLPAGGRGSARGLHEPILTARAWSGIHADRYAC
jgi:hypothetical protein